MATLRYQGAAVWKDDAACSGCFHALLQEIQDVIMPVPPSTPSPAAHFFMLILILMLVIFTSSSSTESARRLLPLVIVLSLIPSRGFLHHGYRFHNVFVFSVTIAIATNHLLQCLHVPLHQNGRPSPEWPQLLPEQVGD